MVEAQGFQVTGQGMELPTGTVSKMAVPTELVPHCPKCGAPMAMNLRADHTFVQDEDGILQQAVMMILSGVIRIRLFSIWSWEWA